MYLGFVLIGYGRVTDTETAAFERRIYYLQFPRKGVCQAFRATWGSSQGWKFQERRDGKAWPRAFIVVSLGKAKQGKTV